MKIIIGTRGSQLSIAQTNIIKDKLLELHPQLEIELNLITTKGDVNMTPIPLDTVGKGWFTKEIDKALLQGEIDVAVHSLKDLPEILPKGLLLAATPEREDARDVLVSRKNLSLDKLPTGAIIGTDSIRRKIQILHKRPDLIVKSVRGNVNTRLAKLESGEYDALILAAAGLIRLGFENKITEYFSVDDVVPSPGQGTLAIVVKETNDKLISFIKKINYSTTVMATEAERAFSKELGGGCKTPTGAYAECKNDRITIYGMLGSLDGKNITKQKLEGHCSQAKELGKELAKTLRKLAEK
ncbi:MAG TPA: hydroxymethylbilane synthase [Candidatus Saccharimonadales bacterium]|nr:hydroxymethylbilane synthase [Candidatus Saccharimonadales bacterium]